MKLSEEKLPYMFLFEPFPAISCDCSVYHVFSPTITAMCSCKWICVTTEITATGYVVQIILSTRIGTRITAFYIIFCWQIYFLWHILTFIMSQHCSYRCSSVNWHWSIYSSNVDLDYNNFSAISIGELYGHVIRCLLLITMTTGQNRPMLRCV